MIKTIIIAIIVILLTGCSSAPPARKYDFEAIRDDLNLKYARIWLDLDNLERALFYAELIPLGSPRTSEAEAIRKKIEETLDADDKAIKELYREPVEVTFKLTIYPGSASDFYIFGKTNLPRNTRLELKATNRTNGLTVFRNNSDEEPFRVRGGRFQTSVARYSQKGQPEWVPGDYDLEISACFDSERQQPSVLALIGTGGERLNGPLVVRDEKGVCVRYTENFQIERSRTRRGSFRIVRPNYQPINSQATSSR